MSHFVSLAVDSPASPARRIRAALAALSGLLLLPTTHAFAAADALPASVRSCTAETDPDRRLACFDREVARFPAPAAKAATKSAPVTAPTTGETPPPTTVAAPATNSTTSAGMANTGTAPVETPKPAKQQQRVTAHIVAIKRSPNEMLLTLDNGQVWQQTQAVAGDMSLREGDTVTIDKHFGSYWLAGPHVSSMKVQQQASPAAAATH